MEPFGFLVVDKPQGMTSHDVVAHVRRGIGVRRIGHAGTLDPMATGVLVLCVGAATRLSEYLAGSDKQYAATIRLGTETDTYDAEGKIVATADTSHLTREAVETALKHFQGEVWQTPPMYSAIKQGGQKLYELARQDKEVERPARLVRLDTYLFDLDLPDVHIMVGCSAGTYIRSVAHDLGANLGVGGHLTALRRVQSGDLHNPLPWDTLLDAMQDGTWRRFLIDEQVALSAISTLHLDDQQAQAVRHGRAIRRDDDPDQVSNDERAGQVGAGQARPEPLSSSLRRAYAAGRFVAILEARGDLWHPAKVFRASGTETAG
jgi:tRNA pseudouridine55 synthase